MKRGEWEVYLADVWSCFVIVVPSAVMSSAHSNRIDKHYMRGVRRTCPHVAGACRDIRCCRGTEAVVVSADSE